MISKAFKSYKRSEIKSFKQSLEVFLECLVQSSRGEENLSLENSKVELLLMIYSNTKVSHSITAKFKSCNMLTNIVSEQKISLNQQNP